MYTGEKMSFPKNLTLINFQFPHKEYFQVWHKRRQSIFSVFWLLMETVVNGIHLTFTDICQRQAELLCFSRAELQGWQINLWELSGC